MANGTLAGEALNQSINQSAVDVSAATVALFTVLLPELAQRFWVFVSAPFLYLEMWWLLIHLVLTFVLFEFYFERHEDEDLGWSAALANSIVMVFVSMELLRAMYHHEGSPFSVLAQVARDLLSEGLSDHNIIVALVLVLGGLGLLTAVINYFHLLPRRIAWLISGHKTVNLLAYFLIVVVWRFTHGHPLPLDGLTLIALFLFGALLWGLLFLINLRITRRHAAKSRKPLFS